MRYNLRSGAYLALTEHVLLVYTRSTDGEPLGAISDAERTRRIAESFDPYHAAFTALVADMLDQFGRCLIIQCHSFATEPLPSEPDQAPDRPDICIGRDAFHSPPELADALHDALTDEDFRVRFDSPFAGSFVPLAYYGRDDRVTSVMLEVRRGLYCDESTGRLSASFGATLASLTRATRAVFG
jgi:N-formylglutamate deformylase